MTKRGLLLGLLLWLASAPAASASYIATRSFETGSLFSLNLVTSTALCTSVASPGGSAAVGNVLKCDGNQANELLFKTLTGADSTTLNSETVIGMCAHVYTSSNLGGRLINFYSTTNFQASISFDTSGHWVVCHNALCTTTTVGTVVTATNTWYRLCVEYDSVGDTVKLWHNESPDGTPDISASLTLGTIDRLQLGSGVGFQRYFDNLVVIDDCINSTCNADKVADLYAANVYGMQATGDNTTAQCSSDLQQVSANLDAFTDDTCTSNCVDATTTNFYKCVNATCTEPGDDTHAIRLNATSEAAVWALADPSGPASDWDVYAVAFYLYAKQNSGAGTTQSWYFTHDGSTCSSQDLTETSAYDSYMRIAEGDAAGGAWSVADLNALLWGVKKTNGTQNFRIETSFAEAASSAVVTAGKRRIIVVDGSEQASRAGS